MPQYAKDHPAELVAFLRGLDAAGKWIPDNLDEASQVVAKSLRMDDVNLAKQMIEKIDWNISYTKKFRSDMDRLSQFVRITSIGARCSTRGIWRNLVRPMWRRRAD